jgi:hypothetical protein
MMKFDGQRVSLTLYGFISWTRIVSLCFAFEPDRIGMCGSPHDNLVDLSLSFAEILGP